MNTEYKVSIITSTYNCIDNLRQNFKTTPLFGRDKNLIQWIVIDGGSSDGTSDFLKDLGDLIDVLIIEKDRGIYDAWNKGLSFARGEFITFIGSDDIITEKYLSSISAITHKDFNVVAFKTGFISDKVLLEVVHDGDYIKPWNYPVNLGFFHTGTLLHHSLFEDGIFNTSFRFAGDQDHLTRVSHLLKIHFYKSTEVLVYFQLGGISNSGNELGRLKERLNLYRKNKEKSCFFYFSIFVSMILLLIIYMKRLLNDN